MDLATALFTIVGSGVAAASVTYLLNSTKEQLFFMRKKAEELYVYTEQFDSRFGSHALLAYPLFRGEISYNDYLDLAIKGGKDPSATDLYNINMITRIYFPELEHLLEEWNIERENINSIVGDHKRAYKNSSADPVIWFPRYHAAVGAEIVKAKAFKKAIITSARKLASTDALWPKSFLQFAHYFYSLLVVITRNLQIAKQGFLSLLKRVKKQFL